MEKSNFFNENDEKGKSILNDDSTKKESEMVVVESDEELKKAMTDCVDVISVRGPKLLKGGTKSLAGLLLLFCAYLGAMSRLAKNISSPELVIAFYGLVLAFVVVALVFIFMPLGVDGEYNNAQKRLFVRMRIIAMGKQKFYCDYKMLENGDVLVARIEMRKKLKDTSPNIAIYALLILIFIPVFIMLLFVSTMLWEW